MRALTGVYLLALLLTLAGSQQGTWAGALPVFAWCALLAFALQWAAFVPAYLLQTERFYDLTGSLGFIGATLLALWLTGAMDARSLLLATCVLVWAIRLGTFLFSRILADGSDSRFDAIKPVPLRFFLTWSLQGLWVLVTAGCALAAMSGKQSAPLTPLDIVGAGLWLSGFVIEVVADAQKRRLRRKHGSGQFICTGLWRYSRHPNYLGEIMLWSGVAMLALPALQGWQLVTLVSPVFVFLLLTRVSGIPLLEKKARQKWGDDAGYQQYLDTTPVLFPRP
ncbi:DUF1295 domain-containing protein [Pseudohalioglobus sediminis]|uniref:DUF1295 domain-containing protein n=1 Tax=Pseudohalioglobus sediminis TaxID=2606449 RepID=A0A5B0WTJ2_9GAMM|nr:DUF1295 domain-containing protein [Pseudohalioglobus sediminis]KAA1189501.1 DUF1295 domain-containing protein [Pseudohalioglobus sediminis]